jgi:peptidoglycan/xylan/chitin deacetylase (PgdA/CDA1 family)
LKPEEIDVMTTRIGRRDLTLGAAALGAFAVLSSRNLGAQIAAPIPPSSLAGDGFASGVQKGIFVHGSREGTELALSFDACPTSHNPSFAESVVDYLERERVPASFFVSGLWAEANREHLRRLIRSPFFEIGLHGHRHPRLIGASAETIASEIEEGRAALTRIGAAPAPLFRPPYLDLPPGLPEIAREHGVLTVAADAGLGDSDQNRGAAALERDAIRWVQAGSIVLLHVNGLGYGTTETVRDLVPMYKERGYTFVTVGELVRRSARKS